MPWRTSQTCERSSRCAVIVEDGGSLVEQRPGEDRCEYMLPGWSRKVLREVTKELSL